MRTAKSLGLAALLICAGCSQRDEDLYGYGTNNVTGEVRTEAEYVDHLANEIMAERNAQIAAGNYVEPTITYAEVETAGGLSVIVDRETGCQYIQHRYTGYREASESLVPRMGRDGRQICTETPADQTPVTPTP